MNKSVDNYFISGCGKCALGGTPDCKVHSWTTELALLRYMVLNSELKETCKWGVPCYTFRDKNVLIISAFKEYCAISFFKGVLLKDAKSILVKPGPNSHEVRLIKFTNLESIQSLETNIKEFILQAIEVEKAGLKIPSKQNQEPIPEELEKMFEANLSFKSAFEALTPGRQRGYLFYFSAPKQSKTRKARIEKCIGKILNGEGLHDYYKHKK